VIGFIYRILIISILFQIIRNLRFFFSDGFLCFVRDLFHSLVTLTDIC